MKRGMGARLEASFRPSVHWGAEFLADRVRICAIRAVAADRAAQGTTQANRTAPGKAAAPGSSRPGAATPATSQTKSPTPETSQSKKPAPGTPSTPGAARETTLDAAPAQEATPGFKVVATFEGTYAEAEAFARGKGLAYQGIHAAVSHLPFKLELIEPLAAGAEDDLAQQADRFRPAGLPAESLEVHGFTLGGPRYLLMAREDALRPFVEHLPLHLGALWSLEPSPLAPLSLSPSPLLPALLPSLLPESHLGTRGGTDAVVAGEGERRAALLVEEAYTHVLYMRDGLPEAYAKAFVGAAEARQHPEAFAREMKKVLIYHPAGKLPGATLASVTIWRDGADGESAKALATLGLPVQGPDQEPSGGGIAPGGVPADFRVAAAAALKGLRGEEAAASFAVGEPHMARSRREWMGRAGMLARTAFPMAIAAVVIALLVVASAFVFRAVVASKAEAWSGELRKWDQFQKRRASVEARLARMQGLLDRRTDGYASLQRLAALLPAEVWLEEWEAEAGDGGRYTHHLTGYSLSEGRVPEFLARLEDGKRYRSVRLKSTERIKGEKVEKETGISANRKDLVRFQVVVAE